jgi:protein TonB
VSKQPSFKRFIPGIAGVLIVICFTVGLIWFVREYFKKQDKPQRAQAQVVRLIRPPPPPDTPPPPPPPEEKIEQPLPQDSPEPTPTEDAPPAESLGLDAEGVAGADGFGLAARKGGRDLVGSGSAAFAWYTGMLKDSILDTLSGDERIRRGSYSVTVRVWLGNDGRVERIKLATTSGSRDLDSVIEQALEKLARVREAPPLEMPQPITLKIVSRG